MSHLSLANIAKNYFTIINDSIAIINNIISIFVALI
ncbi:hypothetical protein CLV00_2260 [Flavobacterium sp. 11]|nr:hypothetical protein CLV00_2260 [Flavobacterium sp. 11]